MGGGGAGKEASRSGRETMDGIGGGGGGGGSGPAGSGGFSDAMEGAGARGGEVEYGSLAQPRDGVKAARWGAAQAPRQR